MNVQRCVLIAGGTGYVGQGLSHALVARAHQVHVLCRPGSENKVSTGCATVVGDPLEATSLLNIPPCDTWVHLVGVPHPSPKKAEQFKTIDLQSVEVAVPAAIRAGIRHFVYVSVAHPAPVMKAYIKVRTRCEEIIQNSGMNATILRPWYVLGPGHRWPYLLKPIYGILERIPATADSARRLGLVTLGQMVQALVYAVESSPDGIRVLDVPGIRGVSAKPAKPSE